MSSWQPPLDMEGLASDPSRPIPKLYAACALSHVTAEMRQNLDLTVDAVKTAVREATLEAEDPWEAAVYAPIEHSAPWKHPELSPETVYRLNAERLWADSDGLIMFGHDGGSYGGGQEFAWAVAMRLPILYVASRDGSTGVANLSRQIEGTPIDLTVCAFENPLDLREQVKTWVRTRRSALEALARHRQARPQIHQHLHETIRARWTSLGHQRRLSAISESGLAPRRVEELVTDVYAFAAASLEEITALAAAMGVSLTSREVALPELTDMQLAALATAATECQWAPGHTLELERQARQELAKGGIRRLPLTTPENWIDLNDWRPQ